MKKIIFITLAVLTLFSCKEDEAPYYGYAQFENGTKEDKLFIEQPEGSSSIQLNTDLSGIVVPQEGAEWCSGNVNGGVLTLNYTANTENDTRVGFVDILFGLHKLTLEVIQRTVTGTNHVEVIMPEEGDPLRWTATCSDIQTSEGVLENIFDYNQTNFWHSQYDPKVPLPHWIVVDLKKEMDVSQVRLGWRMYGSNVYLHVRRAEILYSNDGVNFISTGGEIFREPVNGKISSPDYPRYTDCPFTPIKARYIKVNMTESNDPKGVCHIAYFKIFEP